MESSLQNLVITPAADPGMYQIEVEMKNPDIWLDRFWFGLRRIERIGDGDLYRIVGSWSALRMMVEIRWGTDAARPFLLNKPSGPAGDAGSVKEIATRAQRALDAPGWMNILTDQNNRKAKRLIERGEIPGIDPSDFMVRAVRYPGEKRWWGGSTPLYDIEMCAVYDDWTGSAPQPGTEDEHSAGSEWWDRWGNIVMILGAIVMIASAFLVVGNLIRV